MINDQEPTRLLEAGEIPVTGRVYFVPSLDGVPVHPEIHNDVELCLIGAEIMHVHIDWRWIFNIDRYGCRYDWNKLEYNQVIRWEESICKIQYKPFKCGRRCIKANLEIFTALFQLILMYEDKKVSECGRCPHKGLLIDPVTLRCPGHGLQWRADRTLAWSSKDCYMRWKGNDYPIEVPVMRFDVKEPKIPHDNTAYIYHRDVVIAQKPRIEFYDAVAGDVVTLNCIPYKDQDKDTKMYQKIYQMLPKV